MSFNNSTCGLPRKNICDLAEYIERGWKYHHSSLFQMKLVFHVFITQELYTKQIREILKFALYSFIHNFWSTIPTPIRIINLSSSDKLHYWYLTRVSLPLIPFDFNCFWTAAEILANLLMLAGVIWPFLKYRWIFLTKPIYS